MSTESLGFAKFDHPRHGSFDDPAAVLSNEQLSDAEKEEVLRDWKADLKRRFGDITPLSGEQHHDLDEAIERLAGART
ncbi:hypothetical protein [Consotaella salsifontis]|uniref:Uncharacterized protein n=1 Tax=Consotaella salsifontis TaxID=1365950 RepID=A0A1T4PXF5_9HYPH|nr:hypothetical protein [Consotaella salsifontis]SJZ96224.1 hypothetical protein SAMN05428963_104229 [Consotaella salsifontis]